MKRLGQIIGVLAIVFAFVPRVQAAGNKCAITGTVQNVDSTPCPNCTITFNSLITQVVGGVTYQPVLASTTTDNNGVLSQISLPQGLAVQITVTENGQTFPPTQSIVPFSPAVDFDAMNQGILLEPLNALASLQPPTGPLSLNNQQITNLACPSGPNGALSWGCDASVGNLTINGTFAQNTSGFTNFGLLQVFAIDDPDPPTVVAQGTTGASSYTYYIACHDGAGGTTLESAGTPISNGNAVLSSTNKNQVNFTIPAHARSCDVLNSPTTSAIGGLGLMSSPFFDTSNASAAYTQPNRNTTGDGSFGGNITAIDGDFVGNLQVQGDAFLLGDLSLSGSITAGGGATLGDDLLVAGKGTFGDQMSVSASAPQLVLNGGTGNTNLNLTGSGSAHNYSLQVNNNDTLKLFDQTSGQNIFVVDQSSGAVNFPQGMELANGGNITTYGGILPTIVCANAVVGTVTANSTLNSGSFTVGSGTVNECTLTFPIACAHALNCAAPSDTSGGPVPLFAQPLSTSSVEILQNSSTNLATRKIDYLCGCN